MDIDQLKRTHIDWPKVQLLYRKLTLLYEGGDELKRQAMLFIPPRPDEPIPVYEHRLSKITYTNLMATYMGEHLNRLASSPLSYEDDNPLYSDLRINIDGAGNNDLHLLTNLARDIMLFGRGFLYHTYIDKEVIIRTLDPRNVIDWEYDLLDRLVYVKHRSGTRYTLFYPDRVEVYVLEDEDASVGNITPVSVVKTARLAVSEARSSEDLYLGKTLMLPAIEHFELECKLFDLFTFAYVQRTVQPLSAPTVDAYSLPAIDTRANEYDLPDSFKTGNPYVLAASGFQFVELRGAIAEPIRMRLESLRLSMAATSCQGSVYTGSVGQSASGLSKTVDFVKQAMFLQKLGGLLLRTYQNELNSVADELGINYTDVNGFNNFNLFRQADIETILREEALFGKLPPTAQRELVDQYVALLLPNSDRRN